MLISFGPNSIRTDREPDATDQHHPDRNVDPVGAAAVLDSVDDRGERPDGIRDVVRTVGERQQRRREHQRNGEQGLQRRGRFASPADCRWITGRMMKTSGTPTAIPISRDSPQRELHQPRETL
jgi:hypothetical protein